MVVVMSVCDGCILVDSYLIRQQCRKLCFKHVDPRQMQIQLSLVLLRNHATNVDITLLRTAFGWSASTLTNLPVTTCIDAVRVAVGSSDYIP